jgi:hypothetical protein
MKYDVLTWERVDLGVNQEEERDATTRILKEEV